MLLDNGLIGESSQLRPLLTATSMHALGIALLVTTAYLRELLSNHTLDN